MPSSTRIPTPVPTITPTPRQESGKVTSGDSKTAVKNRDPINMATGEYFFILDFLNLGGTFPLKFQLYYGSQVDEKRFPDGLAPRFAANHRITLTRDQSAALPSPQIHIETGLGNEIGFHQTNGEWEVFAIERIRYQLKETDDYYYMLDPIRQWIYVFKKVRNDAEIANAFLVYIEDRNGNRLRFENPTDGSLENRGPDRIHDGWGRELRFTYQNYTYEDSGNPTTLPFLTKIEDQNGRTVTLTYESNPADNTDGIVLRSITDPLGNTTRFAYSGKERITSKTLPNGNVPYTQEYNNNYPTHGVVYTQTDAYGNRTTLFANQYEAYQETSQFTMTLPDNTRRTFQHDHQTRVVSEIKDANAQSIDFLSDSEREQITGVVDRLGGTTAVTYHEPTGLFASVTNAKGDSNRYTYTERNRTLTNMENQEQVLFTVYDLTRMDYPDGTNERFAYTDNGNPQIWYDLAGNQWFYTYNEQGRMLTEVNPAGGAVTYTYHPDMTLATRYDSDLGQVRYEYDVYKRVTRITNPDGSFLQFTYDGNDRMIATTNELGQTYTFTYDANGNVIAETDPIGKQTLYAYDWMDRLVQITDRLGNKTTFAYDGMERVASITNAAGIATNYGYDNQGRLSQMRQGDQTWSMSYDGEGNLITKTSPLGSRITMQRDALGFVTASTNPLGNTYSFSRDRLNRLVEITNPKSQTNSFSYDSRGLLTGVEISGIGSAEFTRDGLGNITHITDLNGQQWTLGYTSMGRLKSMTDPRGNYWQMNYDNRGRRNHIDYPGGVTLNTTYDIVGNASRSVWSDGTDFRYTYDALGRLLTTDNLTLVRDAEGNITSTKSNTSLFHASYNPDGQLASVSYNDAAFTVAYSYDSTTGLLNRITDSLTGAQIDFTYDRDRQLTQLSRSNGIPTLYSWDAAGRLVRIQSGSFLDLQYTWDDAGTITQTSVASPIDPGLALRSRNDSFAFDSSSQIDRDNYQYDAIGRLTSAPDYSFRWDGPGRLIGINDVTLQYNGMDDLIRRTEDNQSIVYEYNYGIPLNPIVAEKDETTGAYLRYYVWTPRGELVYMIDAADGNRVYFYHFDHLGSTMALTDPNGAVTDSYAYSEYGLLLQHAGTSLQPFTYVGKWGVRQEGVDGVLYHMRARYYDAVAGRFLSRDPVWPQIHDPMQLNPYQYGVGNPVLNIDPMGTNLLKEIAKELGGEVIEEFLGIPLPETCLPLLLLKGTTPLGFQEGDPEWGPKGAPWGVRQGLWETWKRGGNTSWYGKWEWMYVNQVERAWQAFVEKKRQERLRHMKDAQERAMQRARTIHKKFLESNLETANKVKGLWVHAEGKWLFFPLAEILYRGEGRVLLDVPTSLHGLGSVGVWVKNVDEVAEGMGL
jgi:RHS repeat-associated protein